MAESLTALDVISYEAIVMPMGISQPTNGICGPGTGLGAWGVWGVWNKQLV